MTSCQSASPPGPCKNGFLRFTSSQTRCSLSADTAAFRRGYFKNNLQGEGRLLDKRSIQPVIEPELVLQCSRKLWPNTPAWSSYEESCMHDWHDLAQTSPREPLLPRLIGCPPWPVWQGSSLIQSSIHTLLVFGRRTCLKGCVGSVLP